MPMSTATSSVTSVVNATLSAIETVVPMQFTRDVPTIRQGPVIQQEIGVLVGITGDVRGRILLETTKNVIRTIGQNLFGMGIADDMLDSFTGELGNLVGGNMATNASNEGVTLDITPPTVMVGKTKLHGFNTAICIPVMIENIGTLNAVLILEEN